MGAALVIVALNLNPEFEFSKVAELMQIHSVWEYYSKIRVHCQCLIMVS